MQVNIIVEIGGKTVALTQREASILYNDLCRSLSARYKDCKQNEKIESIPLKGNQ